MKRKRKSAEEMNFSRDVLPPEIQENLAHYLEMYPEYSNMLNSETMHLWHEACEKKWDTVYSIMFSIQSSMRNRFRDLDSSRGVDDEHGNEWTVDSTFPGIHVDPDEED